MAKKISATEETHFDSDGDIHIARPGADLSNITSIDPTAAFDEPMDFNLDDYVGYTFRGKPIADLDQVVDQIWTGRTIDGGNNVITYTFNELAHTTGVMNNPNYGFTAGNGYSAFSEEQRAEARDSIALWDDLVSAEFRESNGRGADIMFANSADPAQAYAYYPGDRGYKFQSDVFIADPEINWTNNWLGFNGYGATTLIHELGHSLGLSHPGMYNGALATTYAAQAEYAQDSEQYTIMSYWSPSETGARIVDFSTFLYGNAQTPMMHDILAIQEAYGADETTRADDTTYGFNSTAGRDVFDFSLNEFPNVSIYDAGGTDTIDLSGFDAGVQLDLHAGSFSSAAQGMLSAEEVNANRAELTQIADGAQVFGPISQASITATGNSFKNANAADIAADTGVTGVLATSYMNLSIAYGVTIENGIGGSQRDVLWGNEVANVLEGRGGDDVLNGFEGADTLIGGDGADTFQFTNFDAGDTIADFETGSDTIDLTAFGFTSYAEADAFSGTAGELIYSNGVLMGDYDGDGVADIVINVHGDMVDAGDLLL